MSATIGGGYGALLGKKNKKNQAADAGEQKPKAAAKVVKLTGGEKPAKKAEKKTKKEEPKKEEKVLTKRVVKKEPEPTEEKPTEEAAEAVEVDPEKAKAEAEAAAAAKKKEEERIAEERKMTYEQYQKQMKDRIYKTATPSERKVDTKAHSKMTAITKDDNDESFMKMPKAAVTHNKPAVAKKVDNKKGKASKGKVEEKKAEKPKRVNMTADFFTAPREGGKKGGRGGKKGGDRGESKKDAPAKEAPKEETPATEETN
eukprot:TRINITY_DN33705_c0_g1_i1.p1 TRINITY_DN33705_c0_g1~~TRINITY_DN33705_c0_g1_i1.p1  ORF type:complete len:272 (+),score=125.02 TRINITY_DN33705_c0_g1_i1:43-816(+)